MVKEHRRKAALAAAAACALLAAALPSCKADADSDNGGGYHKLLKFAA
ncbi:MAG: hypothetical protein K2H09_01060 [Treponemataceae bacterium]|nr:hypothetical protein [Treponemataceae bacterium]